MTYRTLALLALVLVVAQFPVAADLPYQVNYQGTIIGTDGNPIPNDSYYLKFQVVDSGGNVVWGPTEPVQTPVYRGNFNVVLSKDVNQKTIDDPTVFGDAERKLQVFYGSTAQTATTAVGTDLEMLAAPYSIRAKSAQTAGSVDGSKVTGIVANATNADQTDFASRFSNGGLYIDAASNDFLGGSLWSNDIRIGGSGGPWFQTDGANIGLNNKLLAWAQDDFPAAIPIPYNGTLFAKCFYSAPSSVPLQLPANAGGQQLQASFYANGDVQPVALLMQTQTCVWTMRIPDQNELTMNGLPYHNLAFDCMEPFGANQWQPQFTMYLGYNGLTTVWGATGPWMKSAAVSVLPKVAQLPGAVMRSAAAGLPEQLTFPAAELAQAIPELAKTKTDASGKTTYCVSLTQVGVYALAAVKELNDQLVAQQQKVAALEARVAALEAIVNAK